MTKEVSLEDLWNSAPAPERVFDSAKLASLPEPARRYLTHAIAPGTPLVSAVRLQMHGEIKLKRWYPFRAEQVICWSRGFIWRAAARMGAAVVRGSDLFIGGQGAMNWKFFGLVPLITTSGPDIARSAAGRLNIESVSLPSVLCDESVSWSAQDDSHIRASFTAHGEVAALDLTIGQNGAPNSISMARWGNPEGRAFRYVTFGGFLDKEATLGGYTVATRLRVGWHFGTDRFDPEGEFFRATIDSRVYK